MIRCQRLRMEGLMPDVRAFTTAALPSWPCVAALAATQADQAQVREGYTCERAGMAQAPDRSLLWSSDHPGAVYRIVKDD
jgi:hypothetical protein